MNLVVKLPQKTRKLHNARTFVQAKHLDHINKSTFYIRLSALRRSGYSFPPTLRFATHWAELTHPFGAVTVVTAISFQAVSYQPTVKTIQQLNNQTTQRPKGIQYSQGCKPVLFQPHPARVG